MLLDYFLLLIDVMVENILEFKWLFEMLKNFPENEIVDFMCFMEDILILFMM